MQYYYTNTLPKKGVFIIHIYVKNVCARKILHQQMSRIFIKGGICIPNVGACKPMLFRWKTLMNFLLFVGEKKSILMMEILFMTLVWLPMSWYEAVQRLHCKPMSFQCKTLMNIILLKGKNVSFYSWTISIPRSLIKVFQPLCPPNPLFQSQPFSVSFTCDIWKWVKQ